MGVLPSYKCVCHHTSMYVHATIIQECMCVLPSYEYVCVCYHHTSMCVLHRSCQIAIYQHGLHRVDILQDDAVSVREAAVDLLGKHISSKQDLALTYFEVLATAVRDPGTSVRKRAVNIMWESCVKQPGFPKATQACVHILARATDSEDSIQKLVSKVFHNLWFSPFTGKLYPCGLDGARLCLLPLLQCSG